jgi:hypothetical protein
MAALDATDRPVVQMTSGSARSGRTGTEQEAAVRSTVEEFAARRIW